MNCSKQRHDGGAYRRMKTMAAAHAKPGKERSKARRHDHKKAGKDRQKEGGLMTVPYMAIKMDRRGAGIELNADYFRDGLGYLQEAEDARDVPTLFDLIGGAG